MQMAEANITTERQSQVIELGFRSQTQVNISGLCNFRDSFDYKKIDEDACYNDNGQDVENANLKTFNSGTYTAAETRYSFFRASYRIAGTDDEYTEISQLFGFRSTTGVAVYNYIRFEFPTENRWDIRLTPISGWEIRGGVQSGDLIVLDPHLGDSRSVVSGGVTIRYTGEPVPRSQNTFSIKSLNGEDVVGPDAGGPNRFVADDEDDFIADTWARLAEGFMYSQITASTSQPEHQVVYLNTISENKTSIPRYDDIAIVGMNIRSSKEISTLNQFSVYVNAGVQATSNFPEVLYDLLTNERYGTGKIMSPAQIDKDSFDDATAWAYQRRYFFDGAIGEKINIRSWGAETAQNFLLDLLMRNGKFALQPVANFYGPETFTGLFTAGNILEDSFELRYIDEQDRIPRVSLLSGVGT